MVSRTGVILGHCRLLFELGYSQFFSRKGMMMKSLILHLGIKDFTVSMYFPLQSIWRNKQVVCVLCCVLGHLLIALLLSNLNHPNFFAVKDVSGKAHIWLPSILVKLGPVNTKLFHFLSFKPSTVVLSPDFCFSAINY